MIRMVVPQLHRLSEELPRAMYSQQSKAKLALFLWFRPCLPRARQPLWGRANLVFLVEMEKERVSEANCTHGGGVSMHCYAERAGGRLVNGVGRRWAEPSRRCRDPRSFAQAPYST